MYKRKDNVLVNTAPQDQRLCGPQYRPTFADEEKWRRKSKVLKKEEKKKIKEESRMKSVWNIDNEMCEDTLLNFRQVVNITTRKILTLCEFEFC